MKRGGFVLIFLLLASFFVGGVASAQEDPYLPSVSPKVEVSNEGAAQSPASASTSTPSGALAFTGGDVLGLVVIAGVLIAGGSVLVASKRRATVDA